MKITNKLNLPQAFVNYANSDESHKYIENRFSVTELLESPRSIVLNRKYEAEVKEDIADMIPALFGTAVHSVMEKNKADNTEVEVKMGCVIDNITLIGRCDVLNKKEKLIEDYKTCSVSKIQKQDFEDWRLQGLMYAYILYMYYDIEIRHLKFYGLMKDWSKVKMVYSTGYPASPIYTWSYDIQDSDYDFIRKYIKDKLNAIVNYNGEDCSLEDKWYTGDKYAVYKKEGDKKAIKIFNTKEEAEESGLGEHIECRKGENLKCNLYCRVKEFCEKENI